MQKYSLYIVLLFVLNGCKSKPIVTRDLVYSAINQIIQHDSIHAHDICGKFYQVEMPDSIINKFFPKDRDFVKYQLAMAENEMIDTGRIYFYWKRKNGLWKSFIDTSCSKGIEYEISYPIFSADMKTVAIGITEDCHCSLGGWGFAAIYKLENNKWLEIERYYGWIS